MTNGNISYFWAIKKFRMKKLILGVALASLVISCKKVQAGGNLGVLKVEDGQDRYSEDVMTDKQMPVAAAATAKPDSGMVTTDTAKVSEMKAAPMKKVEIVPASLTSPMREKK